MYYDIATRATTLYRAAIQVAILLCVASVLWQSLDRLTRCLLPLHPNLILTLRVLHRPRRFLSALELCHCHRYHCPAYSVSVGSFHLSRLARLKDHYLRHCHRHRRHRPRACCVLQTFYGAQSLVRVMRATMCQLCELL